MSEFVPGLDISVFEGVLAMGDADARMALALQLAALVSDPATPKIELQQVTPVLLKLSVDPEHAVRAALAQAVQGEKRLPVDVAFSIIADEDEFALPFLAATPVFNAGQLLAILKVGDEARQKIIATRADLAPEVADHIIKSSGLGVVLALAGNDTIRLEPADCRTLYQRFGQSAEMVERLLSMPDLPLDIRITQARRAASRMRQMMAEKAWLPANDASEICSEAEDNAVMQVLIEASPAERAQATAYMASKNMLTPALIIRAAATGQMSVVESALAHLAGFAAPRVAEMMYSNSALGLKSLFRRSGLPQSCFGMLRAACDVVIDMREEGISINAAEFGARLLEALMTRYETMTSPERAKNIELLGRYGENKIRKVAKRLKADLVRAA
ncbi:MAG: DUF2336 domain-containing protein [Alphaproteobacteria bacterium]|nr:DUF2336 domain-containing protein [Alphaproteobacteria bacterium]